MWLFKWDKKIVDIIDWENGRGKVLKWIYVTHLHSYQTRLLVATNRMESETKFRIKTEIDTKYVAKIKSISWFPF